jgi:Arc/MetJ-type ribon-helix-helix transcriptional regulator
MEAADVYLPPDLEDAIEEQLGYGDSKSEWIREACRQRIDREN